MKMTIMTLVLILFTSFASSAPIDGFSIRTPLGMFECSGGKASDYHQVLKINGKIIYEEQSADNSNIDVQDSQQDTLLSNGVYMGSGIDGNCPTIISNRAGYLLFERQLSPPGSGGEPSAGIFGVGVINFNVVPPVIIELVELQAVNDRIKPKIKWDNRGFTIIYYGYPYNVVGGSRYSPRATSHEVRFDFSSNDVRQVK